MKSYNPIELLDIPRLAAPTPKSFNTSAKAVDAWLHSLPMADTGECARRVYYALQTVNQLNIDKRDRLRLLEALQNTVNQIVSVLSPRYTKQNQPLSKKAKMIATLVISLYWEMACGYKVLTAQYWGNGQSRFKSKPMASAIHHALYYYSQAMITAYLTYTEPKKTAWQMVHRLYQFAESLQLNSRTVRNSINQQLLPQCSINELFSQIVLLGLVCPYRLHQRFITMVYTVLATWVCDCPISHLKSELENQPHILVDLASDLPPGFYNKHKSFNPATCRTIDTTDLVHMISEIILCRSAYMNELDEFNDLPDDVLRLLLLTWSGKSRRIFSRSRKDKPLLVTVGLSATHHVICELQRSNTDLVESDKSTTVFSSIIPDTAPQMEIHDAESGPKLGVMANYSNDEMLGIRPLNNKSIDVWDDDYAGKSAGKNFNLKLMEKSPLSDKRVKYHAQTYTNINESAGGYCMLGYVNDSGERNKIQVGELIGIRESQSNDDIDVAIGIVRRIKSLDNGLELGIQKLATCADAVAAIPVHSKSNLYSRCLMLPEFKSLNQPTSLLLNSYHNENDELIVNKHGYRIHIKLTKRLDSTTVINRFEFAIIKFLGVPKKQTKKSSQQDELEEAWTLI